MIDTKNKEKSTICIIGYKEDNDVEVKNTLIHSSGRRMSGVDILNTQFYNSLLDDIKNTSDDDKIKDWKAQYIYDYNLDGIYEKLGQPITIKRMHESLDIFTLSDIFNGIKYAIKESMSYVKLDLVVDNSIQFRFTCLNNTYLTTENINRLELSFKEVFKAFNILDLELKFHDINKTGNEYYFYIYETVVLTDEDIKNQERYLDENENLLELIDYSYSLNGMSLFGDELNFGGVTLHDVYPGISADMNAHRKFIEGIIQTLHTGIVETRMYKRIKNEYSKFKFIQDDDSIFQTFMVSDGDLIITEVIDKNTNKIIAVKSNYISLIDGKVNFIKDTNHDYLMYIFNK